MAFEKQYTRIMIVDYDNEYIEQTKDKLMTYGDMKISYIAKTANEAVENAKAMCPDVVLVSQDLLEVSGLVVAAEIKKVSPSTLCYLVTERPNMALWEKAQGIGIKKMLTKPLDVRETVNIINTDLNSLQQHVPDNIPWSNRDSYAGGTKVQSVRKTVAMIISPKGGVGKTTTAVNMATAIAMQSHLGLKVAIVDLNEFGTVTIHLNLGTPEKILCGEGMARNVLAWEHISERASLNEIQEYMVQHKSGLWVIPSVPQPEMIPRVTENLIIKIINSLRNLFDFVVIDLPPSINLEVSWATTSIVDYILLVVTPDVQCIPGMSQINKTLSRLGVDKKCYRIINMHGIAGGLTTAEMDRFMPYPVIGVLPEDGKVRQAVKIGEPLMLTEPDGDFAVAVKNATHKIFPVFNDIQPKKKRISLFKKFFK
jgi:pilus assembly protein CpaE